MKAEVPTDGAEPDGRVKGHSDRCVIVGIGASAGGLQALRSFFRAVSPDSGLAYVVVVHLAPEYESHLVEVLQPCTTLPISQVTESVRAEPNRVYVIPPNANLMAVDTHLHLEALETRPRDRGAIDHFFRTLAGSTDRSAVGVILSGSGRDGTAGISAIKDNGGLTVAQDPDEAEFDDMPRSAIDSGAIDLVLPVREMPEAIRLYTESSPMLAGGGATEEGADSDDLTGLVEVLARLQERTGRDFSRYKTPMALRRLSRRMQLVQADDVADYLTLLDTDPREARQLVDALLVTVTSFFRDPAVFEAVEGRVIPRLFDDKGPGDEVRVWSVGCATGEEAYSLAILLMEEAARRESAAEIRVFATDLHEGCLQKAREGIYVGEQMEADVGARRLERFFRKEEDGYRVLKAVRELVVFAAHDVLADPPFSRLDLIVCRNLLIYLQRDVHGEVMEIFHYALKPGGSLVLGTAETLPNEHFFEVEDKKHAIFIRRDIPSLEPRLPVFRPRRARFVEHADRPEPPGEAGAYEQLHRLLVSRAAPPSVLVSPEDHAIRFSESAGRYFVLPEGEPTADVAELVREELRIELGVLLDEVRTQREGRRSPPIMVQFNGAQRPVVLDLRPAPPPNEGFVLVLFEEGDLREAVGGRATSDDPGGAPRTRLQELETELHLVRRRLQHMLEAHRGDREEMRGSMEELYSANEELRSTMEELETSKEELQSMNEELRSLDQENRHRVDELGQLTDDLQNLLSATRIATVFLDRELRVLRFTPAMTELFKLGQADRGRPLADLPLGLDGADIVATAREALETLDTVEQEVQDTHGRWYLARAVPYRRGSGGIDGAVLALVDITLRKEAEEARRQLEEERTRRATHEAERQEERFRSLVEASAQTVWTTDADGCLEEDSRTLRAFTGRTYEQLRGEGWTNAIHEEDREGFLSTWRKSLAAEAPVHAEVRLWHAETASWRWMELRAVPIHDEGKTVTGWIGMNIDIDERKQAEEARERLATMVSTVEHEERRRFSQLLHDDLQQMLYGIQMKVTGSQSVSDMDRRTELLDGALSLLEVAIAKTRELGVELNPPVLQGKGFTDALRWLRTEMWDLHGLTVEVEESGTIELEPTLRAILFQAVRELLFNVAKHAGTDRATVEVLAPEEEGDLTIIVADEGCGFDPKITEDVTGDGRGFGLVSLRQRLEILDGRAEIDSRPGEGTRITITVPLHRTR